jgi:hypothetical protein
MTTGCKREYRLADPTGIGYTSAILDCRTFADVMGHHSHSLEAVMNFRVGESIDAASGR